MNEIGFNERVRDCFLAQKLSETSVQRILKQGREAKEEFARRSRWLPWLSVAAAACFVMLFAFDAAREFDVTQFARKVAGEIALRHNGDRPLDIEASSFESVQLGLTDLAFSVTPAVKQGFLSAYEILGARYCWLEGQQGVHMRVRNRKSGALCSLYVATLEGPLAELKATDEKDVHLEANEVHLWKDSDRLFALVE